MVNIEIRDAGSGRSVEVIKNPESWVGYQVSFSPDGTRLIAANVDGGATVWTTEGVRVATLRGHKGKVECAVFSNDGERLITAGYDGFIKIWGSSTFEQVGMIEHNSTIPEIACSVGSDFLAVSDHGGRVTLYDLNTFEVLRELSGHVGPVYALAISDDGERLATAGRDALVNVWSVTDGSLTLRIEHPLRCNGLDLRKVRNCSVDLLDILTSRGGVPQG